MTIPRAGFLLALLLLAAPPARAAAPLTRVVMTTGSFAEREGVVYVAQDQGFFRKYSIDLSFVQVRSGPVGMSALAAGESQFHWGSVTAANLGAIAEGADIVFIAGFINKLTGAFVVNSKIKTPQDIKGKTLGVNSLSGGGWMFTMLALDHWGLEPKRDNISIRALGSDGVRSDALSSGVIDGCQIGYTFAALLQNKGFRVLADLEKLPIAYQGSGMMARRAFVTSQPAVVENTLRGLLDGVAFIRNRENRAAVMKSLARGLRLSRIEDAEEGWRSIVDIYEKKIYPSTDGIANVLRLLGQTNEKIRRLKAADLVETSAVKKLEKEGRF
ncbi:MAG TPA: ABC transporter substrate-binding protein [Candidatus Binatia bacterium]|nr:ABC transporter substrate-binding protein [Candidatus Binatia bacterium]